MTENKSSAFSNLARATRSMIGVSAGAALLVSVLSLLGSLSWFLELFTHFRLQLAAAAIVMATVAVLLRMPKTALLFALLSVVNLLFTLAYIVPGFGSAEARPQTVRILVFNLGARNEDYDALVRLVQAVRPDIVGLVEVQERWDVVLRRLEPAYPYQISRPEDGYLGLAILSRFPLRELEQSPYVHGDVQTAILAALELPEMSTTLVLSHAMAPLSRARAALRNEQLERLSDFFRADDNVARILIGDLNITPWSPRYGVLEAQTGLRNAARNRGYLGTWPASPSIVRIPIDHCLLSDSFIVQNVEIGPDIGSDHLPLIVDAGMMEPAGFETALPDVAK